MSGSKDWFIQTAMSTIEEVCFIQTFRANGNLTYYLTGHQKNFEITDFTFLSSGLKEPTHMLRKKVTGKVQHSGIELCFWYMQSFLNMWEANMNFLEGIIYA